LSKTYNLTIRRLPFRDIKGHWAESHICEALEIGLAEGRSATAFQPQAYISTSFEDDGDIPDWAKGYVNGAVQKDLVNGREGNRFSPMDPATRAEATTLLLRLWHIHHDGEN